MRIRLLSDLHLEKLDRPPALKPIAVDAVVLAGDIHQGVVGMEWARWQFPLTPIIYVAGNHEFYDSELVEMLHELRQTASRHGIFYLENDQVIIDGVRFLGTTLWTDFSLYGADLRETSAARAAEVLPDYHKIRYGNGTFDSQISSALFNRARRWLNHSLSIPFQGPNIVVSHFAPSPCSIPAHYRGSALSPAFASDLTDEMADVAIWMHGHVHSQVDLKVGKCRVIANPKGYPGENYNDFNPDLVVDI